jgi:predicted nucleic-acid-binding protein
MLALDTNVLVRFLVEDDEIQSAKVAKLIAQAREREEPLFVSSIVLCECVWVLTRSYRFGRNEVVDVLQQLLRARDLAVAFADTLSRAVTAYAKGKGDFADYVIREEAILHGCEGVITFDRALLKEPHFTSP